MSAFNYWFQKDCLYSIYILIYLGNGVINDKTLLCPSKAYIMCCPIEFNELYIGYGECNNPCGFDHKEFDKLQNGWNKFEFPFPLWMYKSKFLSEPQILCELDYINTIHNINNSINIKLNKNGLLHGLVIWVNYYYFDNDILSTGLDEDNNFSKGWKQIVKFVDKPKNVEKDNIIKVDFTFDPTISEWKILF